MSLEETRAAQKAWVEARRAIERAIAQTPEDLLYTQRDPVPRDATNHEVVVSATQAMISACERKVTSFL